MVVSKDPKQYFQQHNDTYSTRFEIYLTIAQFLKSLYLTLSLHIIQYYKCMSVKFIQPQNRCYIIQHFETQNRSCSSPVDSINLQSDHDSTS